MLKKIAYNMLAHDDLRERIRKNKIVVNQIYNYLDNLHNDNKEQQGNIDKIRKDIGNYKSRKYDATKS